MPVNYFALLWGLSVMITAFGIYQLLRSGDYGGFVAMLTLTLISWVLIAASAQPELLSWVAAFSQIPSSEVHWAGWMLHGLTLATWVLVTFQVIVERARAYQLAKFAQLQEEMKKQLLAELRKS